MNDGFKWACATSLTRYDGDIDEYRARYGKAEGEARFFAERSPVERTPGPGNMLLELGAALVLKCLAGAGVSSDFLSAANARLCVGDGGPTNLSGTASVTNGSATVTFTASQTGLAGTFLTFSGDATFGVYKVASGSGTSWTLDRVYAGDTASGMVVGKITPEANGDTDLTATTNKARQAMDSGFPKTYSEAAKTITGATNASPIVVTCANSYANGDFVLIQGVAGNTAANGIWQISSVSGTGFTLDNSAGNGAYTSGGTASRSRVLTLQSTFGAAAANFPWREWGVANHATAGALVNHKVAGFPPKQSGSTVVLTAALSLT